MAELLEQTLKMIELAKSKGFDSTGNITGAIWEALMPFGDVFCNCACAVVGRWLRKRHRLIVWVEPVMPGLFKGHFYYFGMTGLSDETKDYAGLDYEHEYLAALTYALNALPPVAEGQ